MGVGLGSNPILGGANLMGGSSDMMAGIGGIDLSFAVSPHHENEGSLPLPLPPS